MTKPHKWANEIIAWANGQEVEYLDGTEWAVAYSPVWDEGAQYRIKPQPKEKKYLYVYAYKGDYSFGLCRMEDYEYDGVFIGKIEVLND